MAKSEAGETAAGAAETKQKKRFKKLAIALAAVALLSTGGGASAYFLLDAGPSKGDHATGTGQEPESLDKEFLRLWITGRCDPYNEPIPAIPPETLVEFSGRYVNLYEQVTGLAFQKPDLETPIGERVRTSLSTAFPEYFGS